MEEVFKWFSNTYKQRRYAIAMVIILALLLRVLVSGFGYSGQGKPPMYGDYEAQRHWMEITINLPISDWYVNTTDNDLLYWGLDYPPLTAYHSWIMGKIFSYYEPEAVELHTSRGYETKTSKAFMRCSVLISEMLVFFPSALYFILLYYRNISFQRKMFSVAMTTFQAVCTIVDHGHFQYNNVMLGFVVLASALVSEDSIETDAFAAFSFTCALMFKQMALHYTIAFFGILFGRCIHEKKWRMKIYRFAVIGFVTLATAATICAPWLRSQEQFIALVTRVFPVGRGLWEDKVANFWCSITPIYNLKRINREYILRVCALTTIAASLLPMIDLIVRPSTDGFLYAMISTSMAFFLFSYQVHEKTILQPMLPLTLISSSFPYLSIWSMMIGLFSMWPLMQKDGLSIPYFVIQAILLNLAMLQGPGRKLFAIGSTISILGMILFHLGELFIAPPSFYPNLYSFLCAWWSCGHFVSLWWFFLMQQYQMPGKEDNNMVQGVRESREESERDGVKMKPE